MLSSMLDLALYMGTELTIVLTDSGDVSGEVINANGVVSFLFPLTILLSQAVFCRGGGQVTGRAEVPVRLLEMETSLG